MQSFGLGRPWAGPGLALAGFVALGLNMRGAITTVAPIADLVAEDIGLGVLGLTVIGMLPPLAFAVFGLLTSPIAQRLGLEGATILAVSLLCLGHLGRGFAPNFVAFAAAGVLTMSGIGIANVLIPPLIKRYFPQRIPLMSAVSAAIFSIGTAVPAAVIYPMAQVIGWRWALASWAVAAAIALPPWIALLASRRTQLRIDALLGPPRVAQATGRVGRSPIAWYLLLIYSAMGINLYTMYSWLPVIARELASMTPTDAGVLLAVYSIMGLVMSVVVGAVAPRLKRPAILVHFAVAFLILGFAGLFFAPTAAPWLWAALFGVYTPTLFQVSIMLIGMLTRTESGAVSLSAFVQGYGFGIAATGPLITGILRELTGGWGIPLLFVLGIALTASIAAVRLGEDKKLEDDWNR